MEYVDDFDRLKKLAETTVRESSKIDFKSTFDKTSKASWCEIIKDVIAMANSGGGAILFGLNDDGLKIDFDISEIKSIDGADVANKIKSYTGRNFANFRMVELERNNTICIAFLIGAADTPLVFTQDGAYSDSKGKQKISFRKGTIYFRHESKSEPGDSDDLSAWLERSLEKIRTNWLGGIRKVVKTSGLNAVSVDDAKYIGAVQVTNNTEAPLVRLTNSNDTHPMRESELVAYVLKTSSNIERFNGHDVRCIKLKHNIDSEMNPEFVFKAHEKMGSQYSLAFGDWIVNQMSQHPNFLLEARDEFRKIKRYYR